MLLWEIRYNNFNPLLFVNGWAQCQEQEVCDLWSVGIPPNLTIPGLRSTRLFSHRVKGSFIFPNLTSPATVRLCALTGKGLGNAWLWDSLNNSDNVCPKLKSLFQGNAAQDSCSFPKRSITARGQSPGACSGGTLLFSEGCGSVQHVSCFSHVTTYWHSSPNICTLLRSMHAYTGDWEILFLSNLET